MIIFKFSNIIYFFVEMVWSSHMPLDTPPPPRIPAAVSPRNGTSGSHPLPPARCGWSLTPPCSPLVGGLPPSLWPIHYSIRFIIFEVYKKPNVCLSWIRGQFAIISECNFNRWESRHPDSKALDHHLGALSTAVAGHYSPTWPLKKFGLLLRVEGHFQGSGVARSTSSHL